MGCYHSKASEPKAVAGSGNASAAPTLLEVRDPEVGKHTRDFLGDVPEKTLFTTSTSSSGNYDSWINVRVSTLPEEGGPAQSNDLKCIVDSGNNCICFTDKDIFGLKQGADSIWTAAKPYIVMHQTSLDAWNRDAVIVKGPLVYGGGDPDPERLNVLTVEAEFYVTKEVPQTHPENNFGIAPYISPADSKYPERPKSAFHFTNYRYASIQLAPEGSGAKSKLQLGNSESLMAGCMWFDATHTYKGGNSLLVKSFKFDHDGSGWDVDKSWSADEEACNAEMDTGGGPIIVDNKTGLFIGAVSNAMPIGWDVDSKTDVFLNGIIEIELWDKVSSQSFKYRLENLPKQPSQQLAPCMIVVQPPETLNCRGVNVGGLSFLYIDMIMDLEQKRLGLRQKP